jgi:hypothetical protein
MPLRAPMILDMARGDSDIANVDCGENTDNQETGFLADGDTVTSATVSIIEKPTNASDLTLGSVTVGSTNNYILGRQCGTGEWVKFRITVASNQTYGLYKVKVVALTTNSNTINRSFYVKIGEL